MLSFFDTQHSNSIQIQVINGMEAIKIEREAQSYLHLRAKFSIQSAYNDAMCVYVVYMVVFTLTIRIFCAEYQSLNGLSLNNKLHLYSVVYLCQQGSLFDFVSMQYCNHL